VMERAVGTPMVWRPSGPGSGTHFERWASARAASPFPAVTTRTVMNCWESVLLAAFQAGTIGWEWIHKVYVGTPFAGWPDAMSRGGRHRYVTGTDGGTDGAVQRTMRRGDLVFFDGMGHVALATGTGSEVYTFWPPPSAPFRSEGSPDRVKTFTIESLCAWWVRNLGPAPTVEFGAPAWAVRG
jgi:hypothetical protein